MLKLGRYPHQKIQSSHLKAMVFPVFAAVEFIRLKLQLQELEPFAVAFMSVSLVFAVG